jgi:hypothetical protein
MKTSLAIIYSFYLVGLLAFAPLMSRASACLRPEFGLQSTILVEQKSFGLAVSEFNLSRPATWNGELSIEIKTPVPLIPGPVSFLRYDHKLFLVSSTHDLKLSDVSDALMQPQTQIELVEDHFEIDCANESKGQTFNLRVFLKIQNETFEFRTRYVPHTTQ